MTKPAISSRRSFLKGGALAAAPLAVAGTAAMAAEDARKARLELLEQEAAVRELHQTWLRRINSGDADEAARLFVDPRRAELGEGVRRLIADHAGAPDVIELATAGDRAAGRFHCTAEIETELPRDCTLTQMAHAQGGGVVRRTEARLLKAEYVKVGDAWAITRIQLDGA